MTKHPRLAVAAVAIGVFAFSAFAEFCVFLPALGRDKANVAGFLFAMVVGWVGGKIAFGSWGQR